MGKYMVVKFISFVFIFVIMIGPAVGSENDPESVVSKQVDAYNMRDLETFLSFYHKDIIIYSFPDEVLMSGIDEILPFYKSRFENAPELHCEILERIVFGNYVFDYERITGIPDTDVVYALLIYEVTDNSIKNVWMMRK
jgi:hypothetical protein